MEYKVKDNTFVSITGGGGGCRAEDGVPDMTRISDMDENGINKNLQVTHISCRFFAFFRHYLLFYLLPLIIYSKCGIYQTFPQSF